MTRRLHIGAQAKAEGWEVLDVNPGPHVDHVCDAKDLSRFADGSFVQIYASHVVEHFDYMDELQKTFIEWRRVLAPGGSILISVPDLDVLARLLLDRGRLTASDRYFVMRMIFGGHIDCYDYHLTGLNDEFLAHFLHSAGYVNIGRVRDFGLFHDMSTMMFHGVPISLNMIAEKPAEL